MKQFGCLELIICLFFSIIFSSEIPSESEAIMQDTTLSTKNLVFKDIVVEIKKKLILQNVWGRIASGELMAVMGPSGKLSKICCTV